MLAKIDSITGTANPSTVAGGAITLQPVRPRIFDVQFERGGNGRAWLRPPVTATRGGGGTVGAGVVIGSDQTTFANESISGGAVTAFDATGTPVNLQLRWAKVDSAALGVPHSDTWNLFYQSNPNATGPQTAWINAGTNFIFGPNGSLIIPSGSTIVLNNVTVNNHRSAI